MCHFRTATRTSTQWESTEEDDDDDDDDDEESETESEEETEGLDEVDAKRSTGSGQRPVVSGQRPASVSGQRQPAASQKTSGGQRQPASKTVTTNKKVTIEDSDDEETWGDDIR